MKKIFKIVLWVAVVFVLLSTAFAAVGFYRVREKEKTAKAISRIEARKITMDDVMGNNLPPKPDQAMNDLTVPGFDVNDNGIRDDVEWAIFEHYPNYAKIRAGMLQYAQALQLELTEVFNSETLVKVLQKERLSGLCIGEASNSLTVDDEREKYVEDLVMNTDLRSNKQKDNLEKYIKTYSSLQGSSCDIKLSSLSN